MKIINFLGFFAKLLDSFFNISWSVGLASENLKDFLSAQYKIAENENAINELLDLNRESIDRINEERQEVLESISRVRLQSNSLNVQMNRILNRNIHAVSTSYAQSLLLASLNSIENVSTNVINEGNYLVSPVIFVFHF